MNKIEFRKFVLPSIFFFLLVNCFSNLFSKWLDAKSIDHHVVFCGNLILFILSLLTAYIHFKAASNENPHVFVRGVTLASFIKLMVIAVSVLIYFLIFKKEASAYAVAVCMLLYIIYTVIDVSSATKINRQRNAKN